MYDFATNLIHDRRREASLARYSNFCIRRGVIAARVVFRGGEEGRRRIVKNCFPLVFLQLSPTRLHPSLPISDAIISLVLSRSPSYVARDVSCHPFRRNVTYVGAFSSSCATLVSRSTLWRCFPTISRTRSSRTSTLCLIVVFQFLCIDVQRVIYAFVLFNFSGCI